MILFFIKNLILTDLCVIAILSPVLLWMYRDMKKQTVPSWWYWLGLLSWLLGPSVLLVAAFYWWIRHNRGAAVAFIVSFIVTGYLVTQLVRVFVLFDFGHLGP